MSDCILITVPQVDFDQFLTVCHKATGRSLSSVADSSHRELAESEKFLSCLGALQGDSNLRLLGHVSFSVLVWGDERDLLDVFAVGGMQFVVGDTITRGVQIAVMSGTLAQWRDAIASGLNQGVTPSVRHIFTQMLARFEQVGLSGVWKDYSRRNDKVGLYLEYHP